MGSTSSARRLPCHTTPDLLYLGHRCQVNPRGSAGMDVAGAVDRYTTQPHHSSAALLYQQVVMNA